MLDIAFKAVCIVLVIVSSGATDITAFAQRIIKTGKQISTQGKDDAPCNQFKIAKCTDKGTFYAVVNADNGRLIDMRIKCGHDTFLYDFSTGTVENGGYNPGQYNFQECLNKLSD